MNSSGRAVSRTLSPREDGATLDGLEAVRTLTLHVTREWRGWSTEHCLYPREGLSSQSGAFDMPSQWGSGARGLRKAVRIVDLVTCLQLSGVRYKVM